MDPALASFPSKNLAGIDRMTGSLARDCCRTVTFASTGLRPENQHAPPRGAGIAFIKACYAFASCWNWRPPNAHYATTGLSGARSRANRTKTSANEVLGMAFSANQKVGDVQFGSKSDSRPRGPELPLLLEKRPSFTCRGIS